MKAHILVVEDDPTTLASFAHRLRYAGYRVTEASSGEIALHLLTNQTFDVVVTDIIMGRVDGMDVLHRARNQPFPPEVIILTGHSSIDTAVQALRERAYEYLFKPCSAIQLLETVQNAVERRQAEQHVYDAAQTLLTVIVGDDTNNVHEFPPKQQAIQEKQPSPTDPLVIGELSIGMIRTQVWFQEKKVQLTPIEYMILRYLAERAGQLCSSSDIVRFTHKLEMTTLEAQNLIKPHIHKLRKKFHPSYVHTERGIGYRLINPTSENLVIR